MSSFVSLVLLASLAQAADLPCEASPPVAAALEALKQSPAPGATQPEMQKQRLVRLQELLRQYPEDLSVHRDYVQAARALGGASQDEAIASYKALLASSPDDPRWLYLYGLSLTGKQTPEAIKLLEQALGRAPEFALPHLALAYIHTSPNFRDNAKAGQHVQAFLKACPSSLDGYIYLSRMEVNDFVRQSTARLRMLLSGRTDNEALRNWPTLWTLEFKVAPSAEHSKLRERIAEDLELLKHVDAKKQPSVTPALSVGAKLVGGQEIGKPPITESSMMVAQKAFMEWSENNPSPKPDDPPEARKAYYKALRKATDEWLKRWPGNPFVLGYWLNALSGDDDVPASELEAAAEAAIKAEESASGRQVPPLITRVAEIYARRGIRLEKVPEMAHKGLERAEWRPGGQSDLSPARQVSGPMQAAIHSTRWMGWSATLEAHLKLKQPAKARETLFEMEKWLRENKPAEDDKPAQAMYPRHQGSYWSGMAHLAEHEDRKLDALTCYQMALSVSPRSPATTARARGLWKQLGGTNEGWQTFLASLERKEATRAVTTATITGPQWTKIEKPLPKFELQDLAGKTWRLAQFEGKALFVNLWATWCAPCLAELPYIQKLHEKVSDRSDVAVLTLNIDENTGLVQPFLDQKKYTFPVLLAKSYVEGVLPELGIPRNWIVDGKGIWKLEMGGLNLQRLDKLVDEALEALERAK